MNLALASLCKNLWVLTECEFEQIRPPSDFSIENSPIYNDSIFGYIILRVGEKWSMKCSAMKLHSTNNHFITLPPPDPASSWGGVLRRCAMPQNTKKGVLENKIRYQRDSMLAATNLQYTPPPKKSLNCLKMMKNISIFEIIFISA